MKRLSAEKYRDIDFSRAKRGPVTPPEPGKTKRMKCPTCGIGKLVAATRDVPYTYKEKSTVIKAVKGQYCDNPKCREIVMEMDESVRTSREMLRRHSA